MSGHSASVLTSMDELALYGKKFDGSARVYSENYQRVCGLCGYGFHGQFHGLMPANWRCKGYLQCYIAFGELLFYCRKGVEPKLPNFYLRVGFDLECP